jgi:aminoglycoside N3'-acetyltransferase
MRESVTRDPKFSVSDLLESFVEAVGEDGTLLLPLFNFDFCHGKVFDYANTPSMMGSLTEFARQDSRFLRTRHPVYSFAVTGSKSEDFVALNNRSALADDGPFGLLRRLDGKIAVLDLDDQNSMTIYHHIEEVNTVDYRYHKSFTGTYIDYNGVASLQTYEVFVWDEVQGVITDVNRAGDLLWSQGLYTGDRPGVHSGLRTIKAQEMFHVVTQVIRAGKAREFLYSISQKKST